VSSYNHIFERSHYNTMSYISKLPYKVRMLGLSIVILSILSAYYFATATPDSDIVTVINGVEITKDAFFAELESYPVNGEPLGKVILRQMISEILIEQAAVDNKIEITKEALDQELAQYKEYYGEEYQQLLDYYNMTEEDLLKEIRIGLIINHLATKDVTVSDEEVLAFFEEYKAELNIPTRYLTYHIQVQTKDEALALREKIAAGEDFVELASNYSISPVYDLGYLTEYDDLPMNIISALITMQVNEVSEPVETSYGFHLLKVVEILPEEEAKLETYTEEIRNWLISEKAMDPNEVVLQLWDKSSITINWDRYKLLEASPL
jgi:foldase protein PrsA